MKTLRWLSMVLTEPETALDVRVALTRRLIAAVLIAAAGCAHAPTNEAKPVTKTEPASAPAAAASTPAPAQPAPESLKTDDLEAILAGAALHFEFDRAELTDESTRRLQRVADALRSHPAVKVKVSGHCDERGTQEYNFALGQQRAQAARAYLINLGIPPERIETVSFGAESPADHGHDDQAWAKNRRDELSRQR